MPPITKPFPERFAAAWQGVNRTAGLRWQSQLVVFSLAFLLIISHRPDAVRNAQFYAEDGVIWFAQAHNSGWLHSLLLPQNGYFQTLPRLAAGVALLIPLRWAPLAMNLLGITVQVLPITLLLSNRLANWGPFPLRALWAVAYLVLPNVAELDATITEGQWHLALLTCLLVMANVPRNLPWRLFDIAVILIGGLTGLFCVFLLPIAVTYWYLHRERWRAVPIGLLSLTSLTQLSAALGTAAVARSQAPLGATPKLFFQLLAGRIYMAALWGDLSLRAQQHLMLLLLAALVGTSIILYCVWKARWELRLLALFSFLMLGLSLVHPMASYAGPQWQILSTAAGQHYWVLPTVAFVWCLIWSSRDAEPDWLRLLASCLLMTMPLGITGDWHYPPYANMHYQMYVQQYAAAQEGASVPIPIFPPGWEMTLIKKSAACPIYPEGLIDAPQNGSTLSGLVEVSGWVIAAGRHVKQISLKVDDRSLPPFRPQIARPDVDGIHPDSPDKDKGWQTQFDSSQLTPGPHRLAVWAVEDSGCATEIAHETIERAH